MLKHGRRSAEGDAGHASRQHWIEVLPEVGILLFCALLYQQTGGLGTTVEGPGPALFPRVLIALLAVAMVVRLVQHIRNIRAGGTDGDAAPVMEEGVDNDDLPISRARVWQAIGMSVGYVVGTIYVGWVLATFVFLVVFLYMAGKRNLWLTVPVGAGLAVGLAYVFVKVVYIALPTGVGAFDLFTLRLLQALGAL